MRFNWEWDPGSYAVINHLFLTERNKCLQLLLEADAMEDSREKGSLYYQAIQTLHSAMKEYKEPFWDEVVRLYDRCFDVFLRQAVRGYSDPMEMQHFVGVLYSLAKAGQAVGLEYLLRVGLLFREVAAPLPAHEAKKVIILKAVEILQDVCLLGNREVLELIEKMVFEDLYPMVLDGICSVEDIGRSLVFLALHGSKTARQALVELAILTDDNWDQELDKLLKRNLSGFKKPQDMNIGALQQLLEDALGMGLSQVILHFGFMINGQGESE